MFTNPFHAKIPNGYTRVTGALALIPVIVGHLDPHTEQPLREVLSSYYDQLCQHQNDAAPWLFPAMDLAIATCLRQHHLVLAPDVDQLLKRLIRM